MGRLCVVRKGMKKKKGGCNTTPGVEVCDPTRARKPGNSTLKRKDFKDTGICVNELFPGDVLYWKTSHDVRRLWLWNEAPELSFWFIISRHPGTKSNPENGDYMTLTILEVASSEETATRSAKVVEFCSCIDGMFLDRGYRFE